MASPPRRMRRDKLVKTLDIMGRRFEALKIADDLYDRILEGEMTCFLAPM